MDSCYLVSEQYKRDQKLSHLGGQQKQIMKLPNINVTMKRLLPQVSTLESSFDNDKSIPGQPQTTTENNTVKSYNFFEEPHVHVSTIIDNISKIDLTTQLYAINHLIDLMDWPKEEAMSIINSINMEGKEIMFRCARFDRVRYLQKHTKATANITSNDCTVVKAYKIMEKDNM